MMKRRVWAYYRVSGGLYDLVSVLNSFEGICTDPMIMTSHS